MQTSRRIVKPSYQYNFFQMRINAFYELFKIVLLLSSRIRAAENDLNFYAIWNFMKKVVLNRIK